jgi:DNA-binding CsgD family transcriptional regulator
MLEILGIDTTAEAVYRAMLSRPDWPVSELVAQLDLSEPRVRSALDDLARLSLISAGDDVLDGGSGILQLTSPRVGLASLLNAAELEINQRQQQIAMARSAIQNIVTAHDEAFEHDVLIRISSLHAVRERLRELALSAESECVSFAPGGARRPEAIEASQPLDQLALERGVTVRAVYQDTFRNDKATLEYAIWLNQLGGFSRTVPLLPIRMVIVDRSIALLPLDPDRSRAGAYEVRSPGIVAVAAAYFDLVWATALPFGEAPHLDDDGLTSMHRELLRLLADGYTDEGAARRLGLSDRSVRRMMRDLSERLGANSRFQTAVMAVRRNWI